MLSNWPIPNAALKHSIGPLPGPFQFRWTNRSQVPRKIKKSEDKCLDNNLSFTHARLPIAGLPRQRFMSCYIFFTFYIIYIWFFVLTFSIFWSSIRKKLCWLDEISLKIYLVHFFGLRIGGVGLLANHFTLTGFEAVSNFSLATAKPIFHYFGAPATHPLTAPHRLIGLFPCCHLSRCPSRCVPPLRPRRHLHRLENDLIAIKILG